MKGHFPVFGVQTDCVLILLANGELLTASTSSDSSHHSTENGEYSSASATQICRQSGSIFTLLQLILRLSSLYCR